MSTVKELPELVSRAQAEAFARSACFRFGPPALIGAELEFLTVDQAQPLARPELPILVAALGEYTPRTINPASVEKMLPGGSVVSFEAGCQTELASRPFTTASELCAALAGDVAQIASMLDRHGITLLTAAADACRAPALVITSPAKVAGWAYWERVGSYGVQMAANTAATQVSVDAGADVSEVTARWNMLNGVGPALLAAFACSSVMHGAVDSWASQRMRAWLYSDPARTFPPAAGWPDPVSEYPRWVLDVPLKFLRRESGDWIAPEGASFADWVTGALDDIIGRRPTADDLRLHLNTVYPPVRPQGHLEVRYIDAQPGSTWLVPIHAIAALTSAPEVVTEATALSRTSAGRWEEAARDGLNDIELRFTAASLLQLAAEHAENADAAHELRVAADRCHGGLGPMPGEPLAA